MTAPAAMTAAHGRPILEIRNVTKDFGGVRATDDLSLAIAPGELHCMIGPNGAGKSTFFKLLMGTIRPTKGEILFNGEDITRLPPHQRARRGLGIKFQNMQVYSELTVFQNFFIPLRRNHKPSAMPGLVADILDRIQLGETEEAKLVAIEDYRDLLTDAIAETSGDMEQAKEVARERFMRTYSVSTMTLASRNGATIQKYVPEVAYPPVNGGHDYVRNQAYQALVEQEIDGILSGRIGLFAPEDVYLQPYEQTESDMEAGRPPRFQLHYEEDGRMQLYNLPFYALPEQPTFDFSANIKKRDINRMQEEYRQSVISGENPGSFIEATKKKGQANLPTPTSNNSANLRDNELREREERAFREGQKAFQGTEGPAWMKHKNQADTIERILEGTK